MNPKVDSDSKDSYGQTPLAWAAEKGNYVVVKLLLDSGKVDVNSKDSSCQTPLLRAAANGHDRVVKLLLYFFRADVSSKDPDSSRTLLWLAAINFYDIGAKLLRNTVNLKDSRGKTPLSWAANNGHDAVVKLKLDSGEVEAN